MIITFFAGCMVILIMFYTYILTLPSTDPVGDPWEELSSGVETYILTFILAFIVLSTAVNIQIFRMFQVNYTFIFEID